MNYDSEIKVLMRDKDRLRNDNEALRNKVAVLEHDLAEHNRTAAIVAGGMNRLADERDGLVEAGKNLACLSAQALEFIEDDIESDPTPVDHVCDLAEELRGAITKYRALDAAKATGNGVEMNSTTSDNLPMK